MSRILVEDLSPEQREKLGTLAMMMGMDEQECLDRLPELAEAIVEAFRPVMKSFSEAYETIVARFAEWYGDLSPETRAELHRLLEETKASQEEAQTAVDSERGAVVSIDGEMRWVPEQEFVAQNDQFREYFLINKGPKA